MLKLVITTLSSIWDINKKMCFLSTNFCLKNVTKVIHGSYSIILLKYQQKQTENNSVQKICGLQRIYKKIK